MVKLETEEIKLKDNEEHRIEMIKKTIQEEESKWKKQKLIISAHVIAFGTAGGIMAGLVGGLLGIGIGFIAGYYLVRKYT